MNWTLVESALLVARSGQHRYSIQGSLGTYMVKHTDSKDSLAALKPISGRLPSLPAAQEFAERHLEQQTEV